MAARPISGRSQAAALTSGQHRAEWRTFHAKMASAVALMAQLASTASQMPPTHFAEKCRLRADGSGREPAPLGN
jgi:hypothetical protein